MDGTQQQPIPVPAGASFVPLQAVPIPAGASFTPVAQLEPPPVHPTGGVDVESPQPSPEAQRLMNEGAMPGVPLVNWMSKKAARAAQGLSDLVTGDKDRVVAAADLVQNLGEAYSPVALAPAAGALIAAPAAAGPEVATGLLKAAGTGIVAGQGAKLAGKVAGATPEEQQALERIGSTVGPYAYGALNPKGFRLASPKGDITGGTIGRGPVRAGVAVTPEDVRIGGRLGEARATLTIPRGVRRAGPETQLPEPQAMQEAQMAIQTFLPSAAGTPQANAAIIRAATPPAAPAKPLLVSPRDWVQEEVEKNRLIKDIEAAEKKLPPRRGSQYNVLSGTQTKKASGSASPVLEATAGGATPVRQVPTQANRPELPVPGVPPGVQHPI